MSDSQHRRSQPTRIYSEEEEARRWAAIIDIILKDRGIGTQHEQHQPTTLQPALPR